MESAPQSLHDDRIGLVDDLHEVNEHLRAHRTGIVAADGKIVFRVDIVVRVKCELQITVFVVQFIDRKDRCSFLGRIDVHDAVGADGDIVVFVVRNEADRDAFDIISVESGFQFRLRQIFRRCPALQGGSSRYFSAS